MVNKRVLSVCNQCLLLHLEKTILNKAPFPMENAQVEMGAMVEDERVQILVNLGLSLLQAKIYLTLVQTGQATIKEIAKASGIVRQDIYRIVPSLQKLGLAEKILNAPTMYKATPLREGCYLLLQNKTRAHVDLQKRTIALVKNLHENNSKTPLQEEDSQFVITSSETLLHKRLGEGHQVAQKTIYITGIWQTTRTMFFYRFQDFKRALKRGIQIRIITENHEYDKSTQKIVQTLMLNPLFEIRYVTIPSTLKMVIHDEKEVNMCIAIPLDRDVPSLWSNNPQFVKIMVTYFEELWSKAMEASEIPVSENATALSAT